MLAVAVLSLGGGVEAQPARASATLIHLPAAEANPLIIEQGTDIDHRHVVDRGVCLDDSLYVIALEAYRHDVYAFGDAFVTVFQNGQSASDRIATTSLFRDGTGWGWTSFAFSSSGGCALIRTSGGRSRLFMMRVGVDFGGRR